MQLQAFPVKLVSSEQQRKSKGRHLCAPNGSQLICHLSDKILDKSDLRKDELALDPSSRARPIMARKQWQREPEAAGDSVSVVRKPSEVNADALCIPYTQPMPCLRNAAPYDEGGSL